jgi:hypothetical protein
MSRLYDRFAAYGADVPSGGGWAPNSYSDLVRKISNGDRYIALPEAVPVDVSNVVRFVYEERTADSISGGELFNIAPPFERMFLESKVPSYLRTPQGLLERGAGPRYYGLLVGSTDLAGSGDPISAARSHLEDWNIRDVGSMALDGIRWILRCRPYIEYAKGDIFGPLGVGLVTVAEDGSFLAATDGDGYAIQTLGCLPLAPDTQEPVSGPEAAGSLRDDILDPMLYSLLFIHARNVSLSENVPPPKASKRHYKRHGVPLITYKTLEIEPLKAALRTEGDSKRMGLQRALHICRGHWASYSQDAPLFGKYSGTFWKPQHVRGASEHGEVIKDYTLKGPT